MTERGPSQLSLFSRLENRFIRKGGIPERRPSKFISGSVWTPSGGFFPCLSISKPCSGRGLLPGRMERLAHRIRVGICRIDAIHTSLIPQEERRVAAPRSLEHFSGGSKPF